MSRTKLTDLLRATLKMVLTRNYILTPEQLYYEGLQDPEVNNLFIYDKFGNCQDSGTKELVKTNILKKYILDNFVNGNSANVRMLMSDFFTKINPKTKKEEHCMVFFSNDNNNGAESKSVDFDQMVDTFSYFSQQFETIKSVIFITPNNLASLTVGKLNTIAQQSNISHFTDTEISFNPVEHYYNGPARIIEGKDLKLFESNGINKLQLPRIYTNEPVAKYLDAKPGDIVEFQVHTILPNVILDVEIFHRYVRKPMIKKKKKRK